MKKCYLFLCLLTFYITGFTQTTNLFPATGKVGIGTITPIYNLEVHGGPTLFRLVSSNSTHATPSIDLYDNVNGTEFVLSPSAQKVDMFTYSNHPLALGTNATERMRITSDGNVGIGTSTPFEKLDIHGNIVWNGNNSGNPRALKIGYSGGNYGGIGYNIDFTGSTGVFNRPLADYSSYLDFFLGGYRFFGTNTHSAANGINLNGTDQNLKLLAVLTNEGYMGIGTTTPLQNFVVSNNGSEGFEIYLRQPAGVVGLQAFNRASSTYSKMHLDASSFSFGIGDVGIGTTETRGYKLAVNGQIRAKEIKVENTNWPDYVFSKSYQHPTLQETEKHIKEKGHLPGIPSAEEVKNNGIDLGEMNAKLLQKIEELTLHLIDMKKDAERYKDDLKKIQTEVTELKTKSLRQ